jgi:hypothetical protein
MQTLTSEPIFKETSLKKRIKSRWFPLVFLIVPLSIFIAGKMFEEQITALIVPLFPAEEDKGFSFYHDFVRLCLNEWLWLTGFSLMTWIFAVSMPVFRIKNQIEAEWTGRYGLHAFMIIALFFVVTVIVSYDTLEKFPNSSDEYAYLFQAETMSKGQLWEKSPELPEVFHYNHIAIKDGIRVGRFPPGWPVILSAAYLLNIPPWLINPLIGMISLVVFYCFARRFYNESVAFWSLIALALCGYFIFNAASFFSHTSCMLMVIAFVWFMRLYVEQPARVIYAIAAGLFLGVVVTIRYYTAILVFLPFAIFLVYHLRMKAVRAFILVAIGSLPGIVFLLWYNNAITGNPFIPVTVWGFENEKLGFVRGHTALKGVEHFIRRAFMFFYWSSPGLLILYFVLLWKKVRSRVHRWLYPEDYFFIILFLGHFFYYQIGGNQYGPRFMVEAFPFLVLFAVQGVLRFKSAGMMALLFAGMAFAIIKFPFITTREADIVNQRQDIYDLVEKQKVANAVVLVTAPTSPIRPMPIGDLTRNDVAFKNSVIYAQEVPEWNTQLMNLYKGRTFYRYSRDVDHPKGHLIKVH